MFKKIVLFTSALLVMFSASAQPQPGTVIDQVVAVIGNEIILQSDVETQYLQYIAQGLAAENNADMKCKIFEEMLFQKLMLHQAKVDSVTITESQVENEMDRRLRYFIQQVGSQEKLEEYYQKTIIQIKEDFRTAIREQMLVDNVQGKITEDITVTPTEVKTFYNSLPKDSIPLISAETEILQIVRKPKVSPEEITNAMEKIMGLRERVLKGESFSALAVLYSDDPGSSKKGGELGFVSRGDLFPEVEEMAFSLKTPNEISSIVKSKVGYHIIQLIERRGERINFRHILIIPKVSPLDLAKASMFLDSLTTQINAGKITFEDAAVKFSDDESRNNGAMMINPSTGSTKFQTDELDPAIFFIIDKLKIGEISKPNAYATSDGAQAYRVMKIKSRTEPHVANLKEDYNRIQTAALNQKQMKAVAKWIEKKKSTTFIQVNPSYMGCDFKYNWFNK
ncbi:MAG: peptidylprolyl isomerase [Bacteroidota bacterium]